METNVRKGQEAILEDVVQILQDMTKDWDLEFSGPIGSETKLIGDLAFESIDVVQLVVAIEEHFKRRDFPFEQLLMEDGRYKSEIRISELVEFLDSRINPAA
jgi:acyl carrier protein